MGDMMLDWVSSIAYSLCYSMEENKMCLILSFSPDFDFRMDPISKLWTSRWTTLRAAIPFGSIDFNFSYSIFGFFRIFHMYLLVCLCPLWIYQLKNTHKILQLKKLTRFNESVLFSL